MNPEFTEAVIRRCSVKKGVLRNFEKFTGKHLCQNLFFNKVAGLPYHIQTNPLICRATLVDVPARQIWWS